MAVAADFHERLAAAEAEVRRLDLLVVSCLDILAKTNAQAAKDFAEEHVTDRITPEKVRPVVERPIHPSEVPVQIVYRNRRWTHSR